MSPEIILNDGLEDEDEGEDDVSWLWNIVGGSDEDIMDRGREAKIVLGMRSEAISLVEQGEKIISNSNELRTTSINRVQSQLSKKRHRSSSSSLAASLPEKKSRRSYKNLPMDDDGSVKFPVILGRGFHRITLISIGEVSKSFKGGDFYYPIGYKCKRKFYSFDSVLDESRAKKDNYFCEIILSNSKPLFKISNDTYDDSDHDIIVLWNRFSSKFSSPIKDVLSREFARVESWFGFEHDSLMLYLKENAKE